MSEVDVIIVGAGPAGSTTAYYTAKNGANVLLIDKKKEIGNPVQCGELQPSLIELKKIFPKLEDLSDLFDIPENVICNKTNYFEFFSPSGKGYRTMYGGLILDRLKFDQFLAKKAERAGAIVETNTEFLGITAENRCLVKKSDDKIEVKYKVIVAADGPRSNVCKQGGIKTSETNKDTVACAEYKMSGVNCEEDTCQFYINKKICPGGYAWIFPKGEGIANVGLGIRLNFVKEGISVSKQLKNFVNNFNQTSIQLSHGKILKRTGGLVPVGGLIKNSAVNNILAVGDAASHVMAINGGGICTAMICGRIAGNVISEYIDNKSKLIEYDVRWRGIIGKELHNAYTSRRLLDLTAVKSDLIAEYIMRVMGADRLGNLFRCYKLL